MATVTQDADEIRRQMAAIRRELHDDVKEVVATAEAATDWHRYITAYPWASLGVAFAAGFLIVPRRHKTVAALANAEVKQIREAVETAGQKVAEAAKGQAEPAKRRKGLISAGLAMLAPLALKAVQGYALKFVEQWIMQQQMSAMQAGPSPAQQHPGGIFGNLGPRPGQAPGPGSGPGRSPGPRPSTDPGLF